MTISSPHMPGPASRPLAWVGSVGGPLVVVPASALARWAGCTAGGMVNSDAGTPDDYDRACAVDDLAGVLVMGEDCSQALVLADEPARSCYLPEHRALLRRLAADSESDLLAAAEAVLDDPATEWEECGTWRTDGQAVLMDSADAGADLGVEYPNEGGLPEQAPVPVPAGFWNVRAAHISGDEDTWVGLVQLLPAPAENPGGGNAVKRSAGSSRLTGESGKRFGDETIRVTPDGEQ
ncbi:Imm21 family immunity protein [Streptomyces sp. NBC_00623]|uniref:Imm21 family immunity protein n=1 Tax=Streptomyces sp. NBC_00623 TaxID=2975790 RepID=UPI00386C04FF